MTPHDRLRISLASARYLEALEANDQAALDSLMELATQDSDLLQAFQEIDVAFLEEQHSQIFDSARITVEGAVEQHLKSAEIVRPNAGTVTVADVANELFHHTPGGLSADAHLMTDRLRTAKDELPESLGLPSLKAWAEAKFGSASGDYWKAFRQAAIKLRMRVNADIEFQLAARSTKPRPECSP